MDAGVAGACTTSPLLGISSLLSACAQMDALAAEDAVHRLGYDDLAESCSHRQVLHTLCCALLRGC